MPRTPIYRIKVPLLGTLAVARDPGEARFADGLLAKTHLRATVIRPRCPAVERDLGSGLITYQLCNDLVSDAVAGVSVLPTLYRYRYMDSGTSTTAATEADTGCTLPTGNARVAATLTSFQSASSANHAAILQLQGTLSYTAATSVTEWSLMNAAAAGQCADHRVFGVLSMAAGDAIQFTWQLTLPSGG